MPNLKPSELSPRKHASQDRAAATIGAIVEAAARILGTDGAAGLTTNGIARVAGVSIGSVYQYFPNKEAIIVALIDAQLVKDKHALLSTLARAQTTVASDGLALAVRHIVSELCSYQHRVAPLLAAVLPLLSALQQEQIVKQRFDEMCGSFGTFLASHVHELRPHLHEQEQRDRTVRVLADALRGALNATVHDPEQLLTASFQADICALALGVLLSETSAQ